MANIAVFISGSVADYKAVEVVRSLQRRGHEIRVVMTKSATRFVSPMLLFGLTHHRVLTDLFDPKIDSPVPHIELADWSDMALVVPASADICAKMANGIADDAVTTTLVATASPKMVVPTMNVHMWESPANQRNIKQLKADGTFVMEPSVGLLAEGYTGKGRMPDPDKIAEKAEDLLTENAIDSNRTRFGVANIKNKSQSLAGKTVLITAGGTKEPLDPVRYIGNRSSGKMGVALAIAAASAGAHVKLVAADVSVALPRNPLITIQRVQTAAELQDAVLERFNECDVLIMAAAVADFTAKQMVSHKIKKQANKDEIELHLVKTPDILATLSQKRTHQLIVGFAAETDDLIRNSKQKLTNKHVDILVANKVGGPHSAFGNDNDQVTILTSDGQVDSWPEMSKSAVADRLLAVISNRLKKEELNG